MNVAYYRKIATDEFCETLLFADLIRDDVFKFKETDSKGATRYRIMTSIGQIFVYSPKSIFINGKKYSSLSQARQYIYSFL
jgi:hypothetical protein